MENEKNYVTAGTAWITEAGSGSPSGKIRYDFRNDMLFKIIFQKNEKLLRELLCSLLHLEKSDIRDLAVLNPVELPKDCGKKEFVLDIKLLMNDDTIINIEMQVENKGNWPERSLSYLCRNYDNLSRGADYRDAKSAMHIGLLDFTLFRDHPEFYSRYTLKNIRTGINYTEGFEIRVLELRNHDLATDEDREYGIDRWAKLFAADTWEELKMMAQTNDTDTNDKMNEVMMEAAQALYEANMDPRTRQYLDDLEYQRMWDRRWAKKKEWELDQKQQQLDQQQQLIQQLEEEAENRKKELENQYKELENKDKEIAALRAQLNNKA